MKRYLGKEAAAAVFYSAGALAPGEWLTQEAPEGATGGATAFVQIRTALTYGVLDSLDLAVDADGALWQSIETALSASSGQPDLRQARLGRIEEGAKVVAAAPLRIVAAGTLAMAIMLGDTITARPLDGDSDRPTEYTVDAVLATMMVKGSVSVVYVLEAHA